MKNNGITEYFEEVEITKEYDGYYYSVSEAITIVILGSICGLKNISQIHQWAENERVSEFLKEKFGINRVPCYYWLLCLMKLIKSESLNRCFVDWVYSFMPEKADKLTISLDGKTVCSTTKMSSYENPLHIVSAQLCELGITLAQRSVNGKSNEIPAVQKLLKELNIKGSIVVADALNCQKETAEVIVKGNADYLLCVKDNHPNLKRDIEDFIHDKVLQTSMSMTEKTEKNRDRIEKRTAYITSNIDWLTQKMSGKIFVVSVRFIRSLKPKRENQANGTIIFQAVHYLRRNFFTMHGWNGQLNQCTGFLMFILRRIGVVLRIKISNKILIFFAKLLLT